MISNLGSQKLLTSETFTAHIYQLDRHFGFMDRIQSYQNSSFVDTYGSNWFVGIIPLLPNLNDVNRSPISIQSKGENIPLSPGTVVFLPAFSIAQWSIFTSPIRWLAYMGTFKLPFEWHQKRFYFQAKNLYLPRNREQLIDWLSSNYPRSTLLSDQDHPSAIAENLKNLIDIEFQCEQPISQMANRLKRSRVVLTRAFTKAYGISPVEYRNKLRIFDGIRFFSSYDRISDVSSFSGFKHQGQYIRSFKTYLGTTPKTYVLK